jgi:hypothetical protein
LWHERKELLFLSKALDPGVSRTIRVAVDEEGMRLPLLIRLFKSSKPEGVENELIAVR